ncbi:hypothetical protein E2C01_048949 [Portunus trituberculatus]|uniref:Uncharacterized protein n=1 Tax=Portunus trituberculatus TaxID=210409 RepID=A0A5B7GCI2_PORTR|nr:hypothetical protein [Portunus trituberculatus]
MEKRALSKICIQYPSRDGPIGELLKRVESKPWVAEDKELTKRCSSSSLVATATNATSRSGENRTTVARQESTSPLRAPATS